MSNVTLRAKLIATMMLVAGLAAFAQAKPVMIENGFTLPRPPASALYPLDFWFTGYGAIDGDWALVGAVSGETPDRTHLVSLLYRRNGSSWVFDRVFGQIHSFDPNAQDLTTHFRVNWENVKAADWIGFPPVSDFANGFRILQLREFRFDPAPGQKQGALAWSIFLESGE